MTIEAIDDAWGRYCQDVVVVSGTLLDLQESSLLNLQEMNEPHPFLDRTFVCGLKKKGCVRKFPIAIRD